MKRALLTVLVAALTGSVGFAQTQEKNAAARSQGQEKRAAPKEAHMGILAEGIPVSLQSHLDGTLPKGQGVLVGQVEKDSAAAKAGLKANDILMTFDDQKLYSPDQLVKLVRADKPGQEVKVSFLRNGKTMNGKITLGDAQPNQAGEKPHIYRFTPDEQFQKLFDNFESKNHDSVWDSFDEIKLTRTGDKNWRAGVAYRTTDGKRVSKTYTGTRADIRKSIQGEKNLPATERSQLLRALNLHEPVFEFHFPPFDTNESGPFNRP